MSWPQLRRTLTPVVEKICTLWLRMHGKDCAFQVEWEEIDLQDQVEEARAALYRQQAEQMARRAEIRKDNRRRRKPMQTVTKEAQAQGKTAPVEEELAIVNQRNGTSLTAEEVYLFTVRLCDNQTDRDQEYFSRKDLERLAGVVCGEDGTLTTTGAPGTSGPGFIGQSWWRNRGCCSEAGEPGCYLKGYAYMLRTQENEGLIAEIAGGIKKEVSVSCAVSRCVCSIWRP